MSTIYLVKCGYYEDQQIVGYFPTKEEAEAYCEWRNESSHEVDFWHVPLSAINFEKEKAKKISYYEVIIWGWEEIAYLDKYVEDRGEETQSQYACVNTSEEGLEFVFKLYVETEEEAERITYETLAQIKEAYEATHDFTQAMATVGGIVEADERG